MDFDQSPNRRASQASFLSLQQLDPSPIDSPPADPTIDRRDLGRPPRGSDDGYEMVSAEEMENSTSSIRAPSTGAPGLSASANLNRSGAGPGPIFYLMRIQKFSSYAMGIFTSLHLANVSLIPAITRSVPGSETYLLMTREIYQTSLTEPILVALPIIVHIGSGIALRLLRRSQNMQRYGAATPGMYALHRSRTELEKDQKSARAASPWPALSYISISGYTFTFFFAAHVFVNRILPLQVEGDSSNIGLAYVAHTFARHPITSWFSYVGLLAAGCGHMVWGQAKWFGLSPTTKYIWGTSSVPAEKKAMKQRRRKWVALHGASVAFAALWAVGGLGVVARGGLMEGWVGKVYDDLFSAIGL
ncbi:hypothetical protein ACHAP8_011936 [Fusarium lateritium]